MRQFLPALGMLLRALASCTAAQCVACISAVRSIAVLAHKACAGAALRASSITSLDEQRLAALPVEKTVTFSIVAHVDHGKSSLAQRLLEMYGNIASTDAVGQSALDTLDVERERGITVKAVTASMLVGDYLVNFVDTPGHADFAHEVRRSLGACDGALLLVDASQGIEAQTLKVAAAARAAGVPLVCAASKIDLPTADAVEVALELAALEFTEDPEKVLCVSAKSGDGVDGVLPAIIDAFKQPADDRRTRPTRCRVLDGRYDVTRGVVAVIQCVDGALREGDRIAFLGGDGKTEHTVQELGLLTPSHHRTGFLNAGCVGYLVAGLRDVRQARVGDTLCLATERDRLEPVDPLPPATQPGLFASVFPPDGGVFPESGAGGRGHAVSRRWRGGHDLAVAETRRDNCTIHTGMFDEMSRAVDRLALNDAERYGAPRGEGAARLWVRGCDSASSGCFMDVFRQRLRDEFGAEVLVHFARLCLTRCVGRTGK